MRAILLLSLLSLPISTFAETLGDQLIRSAIFSHLKAAEPMIQTLSKVDEDTSDADLIASLESSCFSKPSLSKMKRIANRQIEAAESAEVSDSDRMILKQIHLTWQIYAAVQSCEMFLEPFMYSVINHDYSESDSLPMDAIQWGVTQMHTAYVQSLSYWNILWRASSYVADEELNRLMLVWATNQVDYTGVIQRKLSFEYKTAAESEDFLKEADRIRSLTFENSRHARLQNIIAESVQPMGLELLSIHNAGKDYDWSSFGMPTSERVSKLDEQLFYYLLDEFSGNGI